MTEPILRYPILDGQPTQILRELRQQAPIVAVTLWSGRRAWLVTRYGVARAALTDPRLSSDATDPSYPSLNPSQVVPNYRGGLSRIDGDRHREIRKMVTSKFTSGAVGRWRPISEQIVAKQLAGLLRDGPPADLISGFAQPVPLRLIGHLLGVAEPELDYVKHASQQIISRAYESSRPALAELSDFVDRLVRRSAADPGEDLVGQLVRERLQPGEITREELVDLLLIVLVSGHTTTASAIGLGVLSLLDDPEHYRALRDDPDLVAPAVEELLRFLTIAGDGVPRVAKDDLLLGGVKIRAGDAVIISPVSANRDSDEFADPDAFQPHRANLHRHLAFGLGAHRCLGEHLARMELRVALTALLHAIPTLRLATPVERLQAGADGRRERHLNQLAELPVTW